MAPSVRSSFAMVHLRQKAFLFGGAADEEAKDGEVMVSNFFNDLYQLNLSLGRWFPATLREPKGEKAAGACPRLYAGPMVASGWLVWHICMLPATMVQFTRYQEILICMQIRHCNAARAAHAASTKHQDRLFAVQRRWRR